MPETLAPITRDRTPASNGIERDCGRFPVCERAVRLTDDERRIIRDAVRRHFGPAAIVRLFGSRTQDAARGGDIDLLVESPVPIDNALAASLKVEVDIQMACDDPKVDILVIDPTTPTQPIHQLAKASGVLL